jgi:hypothetical protein
MKICPRCSQTYADESLNFCLNDGSALTPAGDFQTQPTFLINQPRQPLSQQQFGGVNPYQNQGVVAPNAAHPRRKSRAWLWVLGIFGMVILLCGGSFVALVALIPDQQQNIADDTDYSNSSTTKTGVTVLKDDLSGWKPRVEIFGNTEYANKELTMASRQVGYYYVLVTPKSDFKTENATTRVVVKNPTGAGTSYGYGLLIHSHQTEPLKQDYAFLIDTKSRRFRIAQHTAQKEKTLVNWKSLSAIKGGSEENVLEVKDENGKMSFFVNGQLAAEHTASAGTKSGVVGFYVSDAVPIAFSGLEIRK